MLTYMRFFGEIISLEPRNLAEARSMIARLRESGIKQRVIAAETGINQGHLSRLLRGDFKKLDGRALEICKYANGVLSDLPDLSGSEMEDRIVKLALSLWDGSESSGEHILALLDAMAKVLDRQTS